MHEHYDADGNLTGTTVVTRESAYDEDTVARMTALQEYEDSFCPCGCGQPMEESHDPESAWVVETVRCMARRARDAVEAKDREKHKEKPEALDGVFWYARPWDPERDVDKQGRRPRRPKKET